jgi:hypothetical protein
MDVQEHNSTQLDSTRPSPEDVLRLVGRLRLGLRDGPTALGELGGTVTIDREF